MYTMKGVDKAYLKEINTYTKTDGKLALCIPLIIIGFSIILNGLSLNFEFINYSPFMSQIFMSVLVLIPVLIIVKMRGQTPRSLGLRLGAWSRSLIAGVIFGGMMAIGLYFIIRSTREVGRAEVTHIELLFMLSLLIAVTDHMGIRGYMQNRLYGLKYSDFLSLLIGGVLVVVVSPITSMLMNMLFPSLDIRVTINLFSMGVYFILHVGLTLLYRKYNSMVGPVVWQMIVMMALSFI